MSAGVYVDRRRQAHPIYEDWPKPRRWHRVQFAAAVVFQAVLILCCIYGIAIAGTVIGTALGLDMRP